MNNKNTALSDHLAVIGATGKMGSGISFLLLKHLAEKGKGKLILIDKNKAAFSEVKKYLEAQLKKDSEKRMHELRLLYGEAISDEAMIQQYVQKGLNLLHFSEDIKEAEKADMIFEAIFEDFETKAQLFKTLNGLVKENTLFFTNTSAIPIKKLSESANLTGRLIGFHFYNPPAVQKLLELIVPENTNADIALKSEKIAEELHKIVVHSKDHAGFIGNGHFLRECLLAFKLLEELGNSEEALYFINEVSSATLVRPMGLFQLMDYVGLDVVSKVFDVIHQFGDLEEKKPELLIKALELGIKGGQNPDGSQKNGFFSYEKSLPKEIYFFQKNQYQKIENKRYGPFPKAPLWKELVKEKDKAPILDSYFQSLQNDDSQAVLYAKKILDHSFEVSKALVTKGTAKSLNDVSQVLKLGFYHLYGPQDHSIRMALAGKKNMTI